MVQTKTVLSPNEFLKQAEAISESRGKRMTPIRKHVLAIIATDDRCMKAYEILEAMQQEFPSSKPATVYRALEFLETEGFIHRLDALNGWTACNDLDIHGHDHNLLIVCTQCGLVAEVDAPDVSHKLQALITQTGFRQNSAQTEIRATCIKCDNKSN
ncbi:MAG: transcriptional repressor [Alcaligenaceae bacterium]|jgi:Fur family zinc uptake transcriptional regulator|nr:transcriptional repressor [Alcaligenaceae bacterium]